MAEKDEVDLGISDLFTASEMFLALQTPLPPFPAAEALGAAASGTFERLEKSRLLRLEELTALRVNEKHAIPNEEKFELLTRIRCTASSLGKGLQGRRNVKIWW